MPATVAKSAKGTLRNWRAIRTGPSFIKIGKAVLYPVSELNRWDKSNLGDLRECFPVFVVGGARSRRLRWITMAGCSSHRRCDDAEIHDAESVTTRDCGVSHKLKHDLMIIYHEQSRSSIYHLSPILISNLKQAVGTKQEFSLEQTGAQGTGSRAPDLYEFAMLSPCIEGSLASGAVILVNPHAHPLRR